MVSGFQKFISFAPKSKRQRQHKPCWHADSLAPSTKDTAWCQTTPGCQGKKARAHYSRTHFKTRIKLSQFLPFLSKSTSENPPLTSGAIDNDSELKVNESGIFEFISELFSETNDEFPSQRWLLTLVNNNTGREGLRIG